MIHHVFANRSNIGDWLSAVGIQRLLAPYEVVEHRCDAPFVDETVASLARLSSDDLVVIGGGGLWMDYFDPFWEAFEPLSHRLRYVLWGIGCCDLKSEPTRPRSMSLELVVRRAVCCVARDELSRRLFPQLTLQPPVACPSMAAIAPSPPGFGVLHVDNYTTAGASVFEQMDQTCRVYARNTSRPYRRTNNRLDRSTQSALEQTLDLYRSSDLVVSSALHGCIIGVAMGRNVVAVSGDWKLENFMHAAGLHEWILDVRDVHRLPARIEEAGKRQPRVASFVAETIAANTAVARHVRQMLVDRVSMEGRH